MSKIPACGPAFRYTLNGVRVPVSAVAAASLNFGNEQIRSIATNPNITALVGNYQKNGALNNLKSSGKSNLVQMARQYCSDLPSHNIVKLPALSPTMETGNIASWQKKEGDQLFEGDLLCEIETDKATMGFETPEEGYLAKIFLPEGSKDIPIGKLLCIIVQNKEDVAAFKDYKPTESGPSTPTPAAPPKPTAPVPPTPKVTLPPKPVSQPPTPPPQQQSFHKPQQRIFVTPFAKKIARESGIDLTNIQGTGPNGRILASDVEAAKLAPPPARASSMPPIQQPVVGEAHVDIPLSNMRKTIAKRLTESKTTIPHYQLTADIDMDQVMELRSKLNAFLSSSVKKDEKAQKLSINDFIIKATAKACKDVPEANSFFMDTFIRQNQNVDISVAVSTDSGLITPIIHNADVKGISTISREISELAKKAREGKLQPNEYQGGTFTVSNLGMFGSVSNFNAIINPPQSCILAIGAPKKVVVVDEENNGYMTKNIMQVTMSCDHRVVDGAVGARYLKFLKQYLENPKTMLL
uniref:Acetyltransferase component of pyruvate dehydrogenase complex n=1 Tax=Parastrongyloides trichosuri TaxID=131310 RepID=A0A0N4ZE16_PARTI